MVNLANSWVSSGQQVEVVLMEQHGAFLSHLDARVQIHNLQCPKIRYVPLKLLSYFRWRRPAVTLVNMWPLTSASILAWKLAGKPGKIFLCEHIGLRDHIERDLHLPISAVSLLMRATYPSATGVVAVSTGVAEELTDLAGLGQGRVQIIHNPVVNEILPCGPGARDPEERASLWNGRFKTHILTVGSLKPQKNHRLLLRAFGRVAAKLDAGLVILGEGRLRESLEEEVYGLGLQGRVSMPGFYPNPLPWFQSADLFVLSSNFEGFGNVLAEAMACGVPTVSTDCPHGPSEVLDLGRYGELVKVGDIDDLASGILRSLGRQWSREVLQCRALDFSVPRQAQAYLDLFHA